MREHTVSCSVCAASPDQFCLIGHLRLGSIVHSARAREAEFAGALVTARAEQP